MMNEQEFWEHQKQLIQSTGGVYLTFCIESEKKGTIFCESYALDADIGGMVTHNSLEDFMNHAIEYGLYGGLDVYLQLTEAETKDFKKVSIASLDGDVEGFLESGGFVTMKISMRKH